MEDRVLDLLMQKDEITWQTILYDLVKSGEINTWDIDISVLSHRYLEIIKKMHELNLFISGKVLLASAILLRIKSERLITEGIGTLDNLMFPPPEMEDLDQFLEHGSKRITLDADPKLTIKTPQARKRKVTMNDLIAALEKALDVNERRILRHADRHSIPENLIVPQKPVDITQVIKELYEKIRLVFAKKERLTFSELIPSDRKEDKVATFIPLLHLANQEKVDLNQEEHFGEIEIRLVP